MQANNQPDSFWNRTPYVWIGCCIAAGIGLFVAWLVLGGLILLLSTRSTDDAMISAAFRGNTALIEQCIKNGGNINCEQSDMKFTPLMCAVANGHAGTVKALLSHHPDLDHKNAHGETSLQIAKEGGDPDIVRMLKAAGAK